MGRPKHDGRRFAKQINKLLLKEIDKVIMKGTYSPAEAMTVVAHFAMAPIIGQMTAALGRRRPERDDVALIHTELIRLVAELPAAGDDS